MGKNKTIVLVAWAMSSCLAACPTANSSVESIFCDGQNYFYNSDYQNASIKFSDLIAADPSDPRGYWRKLLAELFILRQGGKIDYYGLTQMAQTGIDKAEASIKTGKSPDRDQFIEASTISVLAGLEFKHGKFAQARGHILHAMEIAKQSGYRDAEFLIGTINYEAAKSAGWKQLLLSMAGVPHNREDGESKIIESAVNNHSPFLDDIRFMIFSIKTEKSNRMKYEESEIQNLYHDLVHKYPRNKALLEFASGRHH